MPLGGHGYNYAAVDWFALEPNIQLRPVRAFRSFTMPVSYFISLRLGDR